MDSSLVFDTLDIDLVIKVLAHTALSPFFCALIPVFYIFQGAKWTDPVVLGFTSYLVLVSVFWLVKWLSKLYRNQGSLFFSPRRVDWSEQIVLITGGAHGIGELLANTLAVRNVTVVVLDLEPIVTENYNIAYYKCDVSKWDGVQAVAKQIVEEIGHPTILVNNAGVVQGKLLLDLSPEDVRQTFDTNTLAHFWTLKAFLPNMIKEKSGHIVTVASIMGLVGAAQMTDYCASKAALVSLHDSLRYELDHRYNVPGIRTSLILPGHILTRMFSTVRLPDNAFFRFCVPSLQPITVVKTIIAALDDKFSTVVYLPFYGNLVKYVNLLPSFGRDLFQWVAGADYAMEAFVKVSGRRPDEGPLEKSG